VKKIIHIDMDAFYASVEQRDNAELRGRPVVVGGSPESRSVVCAASYEARKFGVRSAISCAQAKRLCPQAIFVPPRFDAYKTVHLELMEIFYQFTELVEPLSLDEAYLDVTENNVGNPSATRIAEELRRIILSRTQLTASAGVAPNKFLAKVASDMNKPNGLTVITPGEMERVLLALAVGKVPGVGKKTEEKMY
jgi:DNA polymerase-4